MRRPRPTLQQLDSLQRRYDAVVATMNRVVEERDTQRAYAEAWGHCVTQYRNAFMKECDEKLELKRKLQDAVSIADKALDERDVAWNERDDAFQALRALRPLSVSELFRAIASGLRGKGWHRRPAS